MQCESFYCCNFSKKRLEQEIRNWTSSRFFHLNMESSIHSGGSGTILTETDYQIYLFFRAESHGYALYASCRNPMVNLFGRNFEATTTKFCTHVNEHGVQRCIDFHKHRLMASYILKTIKLNFRLNTVFTSLTKMHMVTSVTQTYIQSSPISDKNVSWIDQAHQNIIACVKEHQFNSN